MKAVLLDGFGDVDVLKIGNINKPEPKAREVIIKVRAASINRPDLVQREGKYPPPKGDSEILGLEVAGTIEQLGSEVTDYKIGDRVMSLVGGGGYAEYAAAHTDHLIPVPESMSFIEASAICESYITAYLNLFMEANLKAGETALIHGGGGGVSTAAVQIIKAISPYSKIIVTHSSAKQKGCEELDIDYLVNYEKEDFLEIAKKVTDNKGVDVILDHVGAAYLDRNMKSLAYAGRLIIIGVISGIKAELNLALMMVKRQRIIGSVLRSRPMVEKAAITAAFTRNIVPHLADRTIVPIIDQVFPLDDVREAHKTMEADSHFGKIVLVMD